MERNPIVAKNMEVVKAAEIAVIAIGIRKLEKRDKKAAKITKIGLLVFHGVLAGFNIRNGIRAKK